MKSGAAPSATPAAPATQAEPAATHAKSGTAVRDFLLGKIAVPDHPATCLNPNGREGFVITDVQFEAGNVFVRGDDTMWFGQNALIQVRMP